MSAPGKSWTDHFHEWEVHQKQLEDAAKEAYLKGKHHTNFRVGAAALCFDPYGNTYHIVVGSNYKPCKGKNGPRVCAEETPLAIAKLQQCLIVGIYIVADYQPDDATGLKFKSLLPCVHCRVKFILFEEEGVLDQRTQFESVRISQDGKVMRKLPFNFESLYHMAPVTPLQVEEQRKRQRGLRNGL